MRHNDKINHLGRTYAHRKSMLRNMAISLILHKRINTTLAKAKELRKFVEPLITLAKNDVKFSDAAAKDEKEKAYNSGKRMSAHRLVFSRLMDRKAAIELFGVVVPKVAERNGGYTRILKTVVRQGDNAKMCMMELVDFNETYKPSKASAKPVEKKTRRSRKKSTSQAPEADTQTDNKTE